MTIAWVGFLASHDFTATAKPDEDPSQSKEDANKTENAQAEEKQEAKKAETKTHRVEREAFEIKVTLDGIFESSRMKEVSISTKSWGELLVLDALPQGAEVKKGDSLVTLDLEKIDEKIKALRQDLVILELDIQISKADLKLAQILSPMELAALKRRNEETQEDLARYLKIYKPFNEKSAALSLKSFKDSLSYAQEELRQLKKMYEADDLTEETEEIILKRAENAVARAEFSLEAAKIRNQETLGFAIPREDINWRETAKQNELALNAALKIKPAELEKKILESKKLEQQREKIVQNLARLEQDRKEMKVSSPAAGTVYRGTFDAGKWSGAAALKNRLRKGGSLKPHEVFMTIVASKPLFIRASVSEKSLRQVKASAKGKIKTTAYPELRLEGTVREVSKAPTAPGKFGLILDVSLPPKGDQVLPGMTCSIEIVSYRNDKALVAPSSAVFAEDGDPDSRYVHVIREGKKPLKRKVKVGKESGGKTEILGGLKRGQEILVEKPKK